MLHHKCWAVVVKQPQHFNVATMVAHQNHYTGFPFATNIYPVEPENKKYGS